MARPQKQTVDYFPHQCSHIGKTLFILEQKYGNDGYSFWFKLLETLGSTDGHCLDMNNKDNWYFMCAKARVSEQIANEILDLLSDLDAIDPELWKNSRLVWSQNYVDGIRDAYRNRVVEVPDKPEIQHQKPHSDDGFQRKKRTSERVSLDGKSKTRLDETRVNKRIYKAPFIPPTVDEVRSYCDERKNGIDPQYFVDSNTAKGWVIGKNKSPAKDWKAMIRTWEKTNNGGNGNGANKKSDRQPHPASQPGKYSGVGSKVEL